MPLSLGVYTTIYGSSLSLGDGLNKIRSLVFLNLQSLAQGLAQTVCCVPAQRQLRAYWIYQVVLPDPILLHTVKLTHI